MDSETNMNRSKSLPSDRLKQAEMAKNVGNWTHVLALAIFTGQAFINVIKKDPRFFQQLILQIPRILASPKTPLWFWGVSGSASSVSNQLIATAYDKQPDGKQGINIAGLTIGFISLFTFRYFKVLRQTALFSLWLGNIPNVEGVANVSNSAALLSSIVSGFISQARPAHLFFSNTAYVLWATAGVIDGAQNSVLAGAQDPGESFQSSIPLGLGAVGMFAGLGSFLHFTRHSLITAEMMRALSLSSLWTKAANTAQKRSVAAKFHLLNEEHMGLESLKTKDEALECCVDDEMPSDLWKSSRIPK